MNESRILRIARGSGHQVREVMEMLEEYKRLTKMIWSKMKGLKTSKNGAMSALSRNMNAQQIMNLMKQMGSTKDMMGRFGGGGN